MAQTSCTVLDPLPNPIYNSIRVAGKLCSSTPIIVRIRVSKGVKSSLEGKNLDTAIYASLRRFDGEPAQVYDAHTRSMQTITVPQHMFGYDWDADAPSPTIVVCIMRGTIPTSTKLGDTPLCFYFLFKPTNSIASTTASVVLSKQPTHSTRNYTRRAPLLITMAKTVQDDDEHVTALKRRRHCWSPADEDKFWNELFDI